RIIPQSASNENCDRTRLRGQGAAERIRILNALLLPPRGQRRAAAAARRCVSRVSTTSPGQHFYLMSQHIALAQHQKDAVWRVMSSGNTLLAHAVGAGKTFEMAAAGMKMKQAGLITKPLYVVPNHMLEQFAREFIQLYPNAKLLIAAK